METVCIVQEKHTYMDNIMRLESSILLIRPVLHGYGTISPQASQRNDSQTSTSIPINCIRCSTYYKIAKTEEKRRGLHLENAVSILSQRHPSRRPISRFGNPAAKPCYLGDIATKGPYPPTLIPRSPVVLLIDYSVPRSLTSLPRLPTFATPGSRPTT